MADWDYRRDAVANKPEGFYILPIGAEILPDDLVWSWSSKSWHRAADDCWIFPHESSEIICAARENGKIELSDFEKAVPTKKVFVLKKEAVQLSLF